mmetsp:Transcript_35023/g.96824  ORF Transcript_35023/g.96824 Transcript_35023/m.96824 type:complete len:588 (-) Transcript_35023:653-2416(-)
MALLRVQQPHQAFRTIMPLPSQPKQTSKALPLQRKHSLGRSVQRAQSLAAPPLVSCSSAETVFVRSLESPSTAARRSNVGRTERMMPFHWSPSARSKSCRCAVAKASNARWTVVRSEIMASLLTLACKSTQAALRAFSQQNPSRARSLAHGTEHTSLVTMEAAASESWPKAPADTDTRGTTSSLRLLMIVAGSTCQSNRQARRRLHRSRLSSSTPTAEAMGSGKLPTKQARACSVSGSHPPSSCSSSLSMRVTRALRRVAQEAWRISTLECRTHWARQCQAAGLSLWRSAASTFGSKRWRRPRSNGTHRSTSHASKKTLPPSAIMALLRPHNFFSACPPSLPQKSARSAPRRYRASSRRSMSRATMAGFWGSASASAPKALIKAKVSEMTASECNPASRTSCLSGASCCLWPQRILLISSGSRLPGRAASFSRSLIRSTSTCVELKSLRMSQSTSKACSSKRSPMPWWSRADTRTAGAIANNLELWRPSRRMGRSSEAATQSWSNSANRLATASSRPKSPMEDARTSAARTLVTSPPRADTRTLGTSARSPSGSGACFPEACKAVRRHSGGASLQAAATATSPPQSL